MDDLVLLNGVAIVIMAFFGLWVFYHSAQVTKRQNRGDEKDHEEQ